MKHDCMKHDWVKGAISRDRVIELTKEIVNRRSDNPPGNEMEVAVYLKSELEKLGLSVELQMVEENRPNVIARLKGSGKMNKTLLYSAHIDTVQALDESEWTTPPFICTEKDDRLYGRGTCDMKGSVACILYAIELFVSKGIKLDGDLLLVLDMDEEYSNKGAHYYIKQGNVKADWCLVGEPSSNGIALGHKGVAALVAEFTGIGIHASQYDKGIDAIKGANIFMNLVNEHHEKIRKNFHPVIGAPSLIVTVINGGHKNNTLAHDCRVVMDRRMTAGENFKDSFKEVEVLLEETKSRMPGLEATLSSFTHLPPSMIEKDHYLVQSLDRAIRDTTGKEAVYPIFGGATEACLFTEIGIPSVICGPGNVGQAHTRDEYVEIAQLVECTEIYARLMLGLLTEGK